MYTNELRDARRGLSILAPPTERPHEGTCRATASNLDTLLDRGIGRSVRMLLSFQRPSHLFGKGAPSDRRPGQSPGGHTSIARASKRDLALAGVRPRGA